jgi:tryptophanyl-tRNA synthetase
MSKSYHNTIDIADDEAATTKKVRSYITDPQKIRRNDPGRPEICPVFALHHYSNAERVPEIREACAAGALGCVDCKSELAETLNAYLRPVRARRAAIDPARIDAILADGSARAGVVAESTMVDVRRAMRLTDG